MAEGGDTEVPDSKIKTSKCHTSYLWSNQEVKMRKRVSYNIIVKIVNTHTTMV